METGIGRRPMLAGLLLGATLPAGALAADDSDAPLLVLRITNPWAMVIGAESARFVLYADGTVIYGLDDNSTKTVKLDPSERAALMRDIGFPVLTRFARSYQTSQATDQMEQWLYLFGEAKPRVIYVYGNLRGAARTQVPAPVVGAYDRLVRFDHPRARPWLPEQIEVLIWPFDHAKQKALPWPTGWPGLRDPRTRKRSAGSYSLYLPAERFGELKALLERQKENQPVGLAGRKWSISYRMPLPGEARWMRPARD